MDGREIIPVRKVSSLFQLSACYGVTDSVCKVPLMALDKWPEWDLHQGRLIRGVKYRARRLQRVPRLQQQLSHQQINVHQVLNLALNHRAVSSPCRCLLGSCCDTRNGLKLQFYTREGNNVCSICDACNEIISWSLSAGQLRSRVNTALKRDVQILLVSINAEHFWTCRWLTRGLRSYNIRYDKIDSKWLCCKCLLHPPKNSFWTEEFNNLNCMPQKCIFLLSFYPSFDNKYK